MPLPFFRPPLTTQLLHEIGHRRSVSDIIPLLWEIKRLRALVLRANQLQLHLNERAGAEGMILNVFREELKGEPVIEEKEPLFPTTESCRR
jgi:hypothetical protein